MRTPRRSRTLALLAISLLGAPDVLAAPPAGRFAAAESGTSPATSITLGSSRWGHHLIADGCQIPIWRLDGLLDARSWPTGSNAGTLTYDGAKRPTGLAETASGVNLAVFGRSYDSTGTVTAVGTTRADLAWTASTDNVAVTSYSIYRGGVLVMTVAGGVTAWSDYSLSPGTTYSYTVKANDAAANASAASSASQATTQNGNAGNDTTAPSTPTGLSVTVATSKQLNLAWTAATDNVGVHGYRVYRDSVLVATVGTNAFSDTGLAGGSTHSYTVAAIDGAGNASAQSSSASNTTTVPVRQTAYAYDLADRLTGITPASGGAVTLSLDALGRHRTRVEGSLTDTYTYAGESMAIVKIAPSTGPSTNSVVDASGARLAVSTSSGGFGWTLADLHGNVAGYAAAGGAVVTDATRYDPYGEVVARTSSGLAAPWGYQGRLDLASVGDTDLLDFGFRPYAPDLGTFTSPDDQAGSALNPLTFNRYLYAGASPATLVDPDGHAFRNLFDGGGTVVAPPAPKLSDEEIEQAYVSKASTTTTKRIKVVSPAPVKADTWQEDINAGRWPTEADMARTLEIAKRFSAEKDEGFFHTALDVLGFIPVIGTGADLLNAGVYAAEGDWLNAGLSATSAIPLVGDAFAAGRVVAKYGDDAGAALAAITRHGDDVAGAAAKHSDEVDELLKAADAQYPKKAARPDEWHHVQPIYLGGKSGPKVQLPAAYHQLVTNLFRAKAPYGGGVPSGSEIQRIMDEVYEQLPVGEFPRFDP